MPLKTTTNMTNNENCERSEKQPAADSEYDANGLESSAHSLSIRIEYYRSLEYSLKWKTSMYTRRSSRLPKASKRSPQRSPSPNEEVIQRRLRGRRRRTGLRVTEGDDSVATDKEKNHDLIDIINGTRDAAEEDGEQVFEVTDRGLDESDGDSVASSIASGPSLMRQASPEKQRPSQGLCSACKSLHQKAKKMKAPIKNKLLDINPESLTCDQWVLIKNWKPRRLPYARGKLLFHVHQVKKRLAVKNGTQRPAQCAGEAESSACSRPHAFLQRNLRRHVTVPVKKERKKNRRKRTRDGSQSPRVAKQKRLHSDTRSQNTSVSSADTSGLHPASAHSSSPGFEGCSDREVDNQADANLTFELTPSTVTMETTEPREVPPWQKPPKKRGGFRDLLAQLRGNSSTIVREAR